MSRCDYPSDGGANKLATDWEGDMRKAELVRFAQTHDNVVITPHIGGGTFKSVIDARVFTARKVRRQITASLMAYSTTPEPPKAA